MADSPALVEAFKGMAYQARYIPFYNIRQYTQLYVYLIKEYGTVPIAYGCTEVRSQNDFIEAI